MIELKELRTVCHLKNGFAFKSEDYVEFSKTVSLRMSNIRPGGSFDSEYNLRFLPDNFKEKYSEYLLNDGDLVIAMTDLANDPKILGVPTIVETNGKNWLLNQRVGKLEIKDNLKADKTYLKYILNHPIHKNYYKMFAGGGLQINVGKNEILSIKIPLPQLETQKKTAQILDDAAALRNKTEQLLKEYDALTQSIFLDMFGDPVKNPKAWKSKKLGDICDIGSSRRVFVDELVEEGIPFYRGKEIGELSTKKSIKSELFISTEHYENLKRETGVPKIGDLLMPSICPDGRILRVNNNDPFYFKDGRVLWIKIDNLKINSFYLKTFLKELFYTNYSKIASGTTFAELKIVALKKIKFLEPPLSLQNEYAEKIALIEKQKELAKQELKESDDLFNCLLQKAFKGELVL